MGRFNNISSGKDGCLAMLIAYAPCCYAVWNQLNVVLLLEGEIDVNSRPFASRKLAFFNGRIDFGPGMNPSSRGFVISLSPDIFQDAGIKAVEPMQTITRDIGEGDMRVLESYYGALVEEGQGMAVEICTSHLMRALVTRILRVLE